MTPESGSHQQFLGSAIRQLARRYHGHDPDNPHLLDGSVKPRGGAALYL